jgi:hypothetical protein
MDTLQPFDEGFADDCVDTDIAANGNRHRGWLMVNRLVPESNFSNESEGCSVYNGVCWIHMEE